MAEVPGVGAIVAGIKARIAHIEDQLRQHRDLGDELERLRDALGHLEGGVSARVPGRRARVNAESRPTTAARKRTATSTGASAPSTRRRSAAAPRGQTRARILDALMDSPKTAGEIAAATGVPRGSASTTLSNSPSPARSSRPSAATSCPNSRPARAPDARRGSIRYGSVRPSRWSPPGIWFPACPPTSGATCTAPGDVTGAARLSMSNGRRRARCCSVARAQYRAERRPEHSRTGHGARVRNHGRRATGSRDGRLAFTRRYPLSGPMRGA